MHRIRTALMLLTLALTAACMDQEVTPMEPDIDVAFSVGAGGSVTYEVTVTNETGGQPFTPPLAVTHKKSLDVFEVGQLASFGVKEIAENGNLGPLADALGMDNKVSDLVIALPSSPSAPPPILPGDSRTFTITAAKGAKFFSFVSMLICTNDGFTGLDGVRLPKDDDDASVFTLAAYDAGTEINTEDLADIVPPCAPLTSFPSTDPGTGMSDPALQEGGVIHMHAGVLGIDDLDPDLHGWTNPVATVSITRLDKSGKSKSSKKSKKSKKSKND